MGYVFAGWYLTDTLYNFNSVVESNLRLKANWEKLTYTVKFETEYGTVANQSIRYKEKVVLPETPQGPTIWNLTIDIKTNIRLLNGILIKM